MTHGPRKSAEVRAAALYGLEHGEEVERCCAIVAELGAKEALPALRKLEEYQELVEKTIAALENPPDRTPGGR